MLCISPPPRCALAIAQLSAHLKASHLELEITSSPVVQIVIGSSHILKPDDYVAAFFDH